MLRASLLTDVKILPQARQGSYFFNRIGQKQTFGSDGLSPPVLVFRMERPATLIAISDLALHTNSKFDLTLCRVTAIISSLCRMKAINK
ncbi:hypothetical protein F6S12_20640 [Pseudomonas sp. JV245A]|nr:hypothetical protein [Pseudomonas sp. JV245A]